MSESSDPETLRLLMAERAIERVLATYCRGIDRRDRALVRSCYHGDAVDNHGSFVGDANGFIDWVFPLLAKYDHTFHFLGNTLIDVDLAGDVARSESYGIAHHRRAGGADHFNLITGFRYVDDFRFEPETGWRIAHRVAVTDWSRIDHEDSWWPAPESFLSGQPSPNDASDKPIGALGDV